MFKKLADELKEQRIKQDITLQQISTKTRIDLKFLQAIEDGNFEVLPDVYLKAFIKSYAAAVGLNPDETIQKYEAARAGKELNDRKLAEEESFEIKREEKPRPAKKEFVVTDSSLNSPVDEDEFSKGLPKNTLILIGAAVLLLVILAIAYMLLFNDKGEEIIKEQPDQTYSEESVERFEVEEPAPQVDSAALLNTAGNFGDSLTLSIKSSDLTWVRITFDDNAKTQDLNIQPNSERILKAKNNFRLTLGNAGAVQLTLNNQPLDLKAKPGEVKSVRIDTTGLQVLNISKPLITK